MKLEIEITDGMAAKLQGRANWFAVEPADIAKMILADELAKSKKPGWADKLNNVVTLLNNALTAASEREAPKDGDGAHA